MIFLSLCFAGCGTSIFNLSNFIIPNDEEFLKTINELDTPQKICDYMTENFQFEPTLWECYSPYQIWLLNTQNKVGDCNDYACFAVFVANWHGYETYQIRVFFKYIKYSHFLAVYVEDGKYNYSSSWKYRPIGVDSFKEVVDDYYYGNEISKYIVYDYWNNIIEKGYNN